MIWDIIFIFGGILCWGIVKKKFDTELVSIKGIGTILILFCILECIKYLVMTVF